MPNLDPAARAAVAAWMQQPCPHGWYPACARHACPDCLLAFADAQRDLQTEEAYEEGRRVGERVGRAEEREACAVIAQHHQCVCSGKPQDLGEMIRARRARRAS
jgi:hypothetical protein